MIKVKILYRDRLPDVTEYDTREEAEDFIRICKKWGLNIVSYEIEDEYRQRQHKA